jgi:hypothetical protein
MAMVVGLMVKAVVPVAGLCLSSNLKSLSCCGPSRSD